MSRRLSSYNTLAQITKRDCWISATTVAIFMALDEISSIRIENKRNVIFPNGRFIKLKSDPENYEDTIIRALRVYFSNNDSIYQSSFTKDSIDILGCPDLISVLLFGKRFMIWATSWLSFYPKIYVEKIKSMLELRKSKEVFMFSFNFNPQHLFVFSDIKNNTLEVIDTSENKITRHTIDISKICIFFKLDLSGF